MKLSRENEFIVDPFKNKNSANTKSLQENKAKLKKMLKKYLMISNIT